MKMDMKKVSWIRNNLNLILKKSEDREVGLRF